MEYSIENEELRVTAATHGAELMSIYNKKKQKEYLWDGKKEFWGRRSPVLFPFVGAVKDKQFVHHGKSYPMGQHGFARDMDFQRISETDADNLEMWFELVSNEETFAKYPFTFSLKIGYRLEKNSIKIMWRVCNHGEDTMYFSIGAHPAFLCPIDESNRDDCYLYLEGVTQQAELSIIDESCGLIDSTGTLDNLKVDKNGSLVRISDELFAKDALILENHQTQKVSLCLPDTSPYVTVQFDAPLVGIWSPARKHAPFVCIEPWYGRCDAKNFEGELAERKWGNTLEPSQSFEAGYTICIH